MFVINIYRVKSLDFNIYISNGIIIIEVFMDFFYDFEV